MATTRPPAIPFDVERPSRYAGGELHAVGLPQPGDRRMALVFPDTYEIGMSHVGMRILYHLVNDTPGLHCERSFHPWVDQAERLRRVGLPLTTLETGTPLARLPLIGFSLPYELLYANVLSVLDLAGIPFESASRGEEHPIVIAGGPACFNPEPMAPYLDLVVVGEAEGVLPDLCRLASEPGRSREERLTAMAALPGCLRPSDVDVAWDETGRISRLALRGRPEGAVIEKAWSPSLDDTYFPCSPLVPNTEIVHDRANLEVHRGCVHGCRFCQAGYIYRPFRSRSKEKLLEMATRIIETTGYEELGLVSLNTVDHPDILEMTDVLTREFDARRTALGFPSLRMDDVSTELARRLGSGKRTQVTLAPEAGSQRMRDAINKGLDEEQILASVEAFVASGWRDLKLYFMVGLPGETDEDVTAILKLVDAILERGRRAAGGGPGRPFGLTVHVSSFVAKAHTAFQWEAQASEELIRHRMQILHDGFRRNRRVTLKWRDSETGVVEGLLARGDRRLAPVIRRVFEDGGSLESWSDRFDAGRWTRAMAAEGLSMDDFVFRARDDDEILPWDLISCGVSRDFLLRERNRAREGVPTPDCVHHECSACGFGPDCPTKEARRA